MNIFNTIAKYFTVDSIVLIVGILVILSMVALIVANNTAKKRAISNSITIFVSSILFFTFLGYQEISKRQYEGTPDFICNVFERDDSGNILYEYRPLVNSLGVHKTDIEGNVVEAKFPKLKLYYFPLQDIKLVNGILNIRLQYKNDEDALVEHYCGFDISPTFEKGLSPEAKKKQQEERQELRKWYNSLKTRKETQDSVNAIDKLSKLSPKETEELAEAMKNGKKSVKKTEKAKKALDALKESIEKKQAEQKGKQGEQGQGQKGKGTSVKPADGFMLTLPASKKARSELEGENGEEARSGYENDVENPNKGWDSSNGSLKASKQEQDDAELKNSD